MDSFRFDDVHCLNLNRIVLSSGRSLINMKLRLGLLFLLLSVLGQIGLAQQSPVAPSDPSVPERPINWVKLIPNVARDQKTIWWRAPVSLAKGKHLKPAIAITAATAALVAAVDVPSGKYFRQTTSLG